MYELNIDKLYSQKNKRDMTLDDLNESNPHLDWTEFKSGQEGKILNFVKKYNSLVDKINEGTAPKIISSSVRPKEVRDRYMKITENYFKKNNYEIINLIGTKENIERFKKEYIQEKNTLNENLFDTHTYSNLTLPAKNETKIPETVKNKMTRMMLYDLFHPGEDTLGKFVEAELNKKDKRNKKEIKQTVQNAQEKKPEGKIIQFIPKYIITNGIEYERSTLANVKFAKSN